MSTGVGVSSCCMSGALHNHATPQGREEKVADVDTYVAEPESKSKAQTVIFLTDIFGHKLPNTQILADQWAKEGFYVYVPDILSGDPLSIDLLSSIEPNLKDKESMGLVQSAKNAAVTAAAFGTWLPKHREGVTLPIVNEVVDKIKAVPGTEKVGVVGFCFGGRYAILEAGRGVVDAAVANHPSLVAVPGDFEPVQKPLSIAVGTKDSLLDDKSNDQIKETLDAKSGVPTEVVKYEDQVHGFTLRGDWSSDKDREAMDNALKQGVAWFKKYLA